MTPVFFIDRALGRYIFPDALREAGVNVECHHDHFVKDDVDDPTWISWVAGKGWYALSQDRRIYYNAVQRQAVIDAGLGYFVLTGGSEKKEVIAKSFIASYKTVLRFIEKTPRPFIASVNQTKQENRSGRIYLKYPKATQ